MAISRGSWAKGDRAAAVPDRSVYLMDVTGNDKFSLPVECGLQDWTMHTICGASVRECHFELRFSIVGLSRKPTEGHFQGAGIGAISYVERNNCQRPSK